MMITAAFKTWIANIRGLLSNPAPLAIFAGLYALLLATLFGFVSTREATLWQVTVTLSFLVLIPAEFFILQSSIVRHTHDRRFHWLQILRDSTKIAIVTLPVILIGYGLLLLLNKWAAHYPITTAPLRVWPSPKALSAANKLPLQPLHWPTILFGTAKGLLLGIVLPLASIHLWIEVSSDQVSALFGGGARGVLNRLGRVLSRAFGSTSVFVYALGLLVFALIPYAILFVNISPKGTKGDFATFIARLLLVFVFSLFGWIVTVSSLSQMNAETEPVTHREMSAPAEAAA